MRLVHVCLNLEDEGRESVRTGINALPAGHAGQRRYRHLKKALQKRLYTEVVQGRAEENRTEQSRADRLQVKVISRAVDQLHVIFQCTAQTLPDQLIQPLRLIQAAGHGRDTVLATVELLKRENLLTLAVVYALEVASAADGPVHGIGPDAELLFQFLKQVIGAACLPVQLVDKGEYRDVTHRTDPEQLSGLRLNALRRVDDHYGGIGRHQRPVGVLREVLVARGIKDVDAVTVIFKLHHRRGDGNSSLLLQFHPVGYRVPGGGFSLDRTGHLNRSAVEQEFFRQGRFTGIRVRDDGKGSSSVDFFIQSGHISFNAPIAGY